MISRLYILLNVNMTKLFEIGRKKLLRKARRIEKRDVSNLSNKASLKIVNRHNASKKLKRIFERLGKEIHVLILK